MSLFCHVTSDTYLTFTVKTQSNNLIYEGNDYTVLQQILYKIISFMHIEEGKSFRKISAFLKENFIEDLTYFEKKNKMKIDIISDNSLIIPEYIIDIKNKSKKTIELIEYFEKLKNLDDLTKDKKIIDIKKRKKTYRKRKFYKKTK